MDINNHFEYMTHFFILTDIQGEMSTIIAGTQMDEILTLIPIAIEGLRDCEVVTLLDFDHEAFAEQAQGVGCTYDFEVQVTWTGDPDEVDTLPFKIERDVPLTMDRFS